MTFSIEKYRFKTEHVLENLPSEVSLMLDEHAQQIEVKKGIVIFKEGYYSKGIYILKNGKVKIFQLSKDGQEQVAYIYKNGEIMGYRPLLCHEPHPVTAITLEECVFSFIPEKYFLKILDSSPALCMKLLVSLAHEFSVWINTMSILAQQPVRERLALVLLILNEKYQKEENFPVTINLSRINIANYARTTIETLARMLRYLKDEEIIKTEGRGIIILQPKELEKIAAF